MEAMMSMLPLFFMQIPMVFAVAFIAPKINQNRVLWVVVSIIPVIGFIAALFTSMMSPNVCPILSVIPLNCCSFRAPSKWTYITVA